MEKYDASLTEETNKALHPLPDGWSLIRYASWLCTIVGGRVHNNVEKRVTSILRPRTQSVPDKYLRFVMRAQLFLESYSTE